MSRSVGQGIGQATRGLRTSNGPDGSRRIRKVGAARRSSRPGRCGGRSRSSAPRKASSASIATSLADQPRAEADDVGIVVLAGQMGGGDVVDRRSTNAGDLVGRDGHADARPADEHAELGLARGDGATDRGRVVGVVDPFLASACPWSITSWPSSRSRSASRCLRAKPAWSAPTAMMVTGEL